MKNIGIIGLGGISHRVAKGVKFSKNAHLYAVASRSEEKAKQFHEQYGSEVYYSDYEELLEDNKVDLVYICTPNKLHYVQILQCLSHKKHVLCEKPLVSDMRQLDEVFTYATAQGCFLMEAEKTLFTPLNKKIRELIEEGRIGTLKHIEGSYSYAFDANGMAADHWCFSKEDGGSAYDVGVYPLCYANWFAGSDIQEIHSIKNTAALGYDTFAQALLRYENGITASVRSGWEIPMENRGYLYGSQGVIITENFWKNTEAILKTNDGEVMDIRVAMDSDFTGEIEHAVECIERGLLESPVLPYHASKEIMKVLEQIKRS